MPLLSKAQTNHPVVSDDYIRLASQVDSTPRRLFTLPAGSANRDVMQVIGDMSTPAQIRKISTSNNRILLITTARELSITGSFRTNVEASRASRLPALQHEYAQGQDGKYQGPETGSLFSYGPAMTSLEYDGSQYAYDKNGRLVPTGSGNGHAAQVYNNSILRHGLSLDNSIRLKVNYQSLQGAPWIMDLNAGQQYDRSIIKQNNNTRRQAGIALNRKFHHTNITARYDYNTSHFDYSNRNGFLNRVYQYSMLTPVSFQNAQNTTHSYSKDADNPLFLLQAKENGYENSQHLASFKIEQQENRFRYSLIPAIQYARSSHTEVYAAGTTGFPAGNTTQRRQQDFSFLTKGNINYKLADHIGDFNLPSQVYVDYNYADIRSDIKYLHTAAAYKYTRRTHEPSFSYIASYSNNNIESIDLQLGNKLYISNTADRQSYWLPDIRISGTVTPEIVDKEARISYGTRLNRFNSERQLNQSMASLNLLNYTVNTLSGLLPVTEVSSFRQLRPIEHLEWTNTLRLDYRNFYFTANYYIRQTTHDVMPVITDNTILLKNLASHVTKGLELSLMHIMRQGLNKVSVNNTLLFSTYRNRITAVTPGYDHTPVAGLSDVHTAIVKGAPSNVIVGTAYLRNAAHEIVRAADGTPLAAPALQVIGNSNPDFIWNLTNDIYYRSFSMSLTWQWRKGGQMWNGTQSVLDQYGRSAASAVARKSNPVTYTNIAEAYIQRADHLQLSNIAVGMVRRYRGYVNKLKVSAYVHNILLWTPYKGSVLNQPLLDQSNVNGLDLFNLPATSTAGIELTLSF
jgi:hypothetical protein